MDSAQIETIFNQIQNTCICPICSGRLELEYFFFICTSCKQVYPIHQTIPDFLVSKSLSETTVGNLSVLYDKASEKYKGSAKSCGASNSYFQNRFNIVDRWINFSKTSNLKILDIGCGTGLMSQYLVSKNEVWGVDISTRLLRFAENRGIKAIRCSAETLPFKTDEFDLVLCMGVLPYYSDPNPIISQICRVTKPNGKILISSIANSLLIRWVRTLKNLFWKKSQLKRLYSLHDIHTSLVKQGVTILDAVICLNDEAISYEESVLPIRFKLLARDLVLLGSCD